MVEAAASAGVTRMIAMGVNLERSQTAVSLAQRFGAVWAGVGHMPTEHGRPDIEALRSLAKEDRVVAIGEVGLEFEEPGTPPPDLQQERLDRLFALAVELDLPVSIHNRGAANELLELIGGHPGLRGAMHYFALEWEWAERFLALGFYLSFAGLVTRPSRQGLREVVKQCPADRFLLETDSPYGNAHKRMGVPNRPAFLLDTAQLVAQIRGVSLEQLGERETTNALALFKRMR